MLSKPMISAIASIAVGILAAGSALAQGTVKVGLVVAMTGEQASTGRQVKAGVDLYMKEHGNKVAGKTIQVILRDFRQRTRPHQAAGAGIDRQRQGQCPRRF